MKTKIMAVMAVACLMMAGIAHAELTDNKNGTITDTAQGLVWLKKADCFWMQDLNAAKSSASGLHSGQCGLSDNSSAGQWRLPTKEELKTRSQNISGFEDVRQAYYWSSSYEPGRGPYGVSMLGGFVSLLTQSSSVHVWPVRFPVRGK